MTINDILNSDLSDAQKIAMIKILSEDPVYIHRQGGEIVEKSEESQELNSTIEITIGNKTYNVQIAESEDEKYTGLSKTSSLKENEGMLFVYNEPLEDLWFTCEDMSYPIDVIFIDEEGIVTSVHPTEAGDSKPIVDEANNAQFVLEVNINSGIQVGDELDYEKQEDEELTDDDKKVISGSKMLVLDELGNVLVKLEGGERLFSRIFTKKVIKTALKAFKTDKDVWYRKVGRMVFKELNAQDERPVEYVGTN